MKDDKSKLDSYVRAYHIRRLNNRVRVTVSGHMGMLESGRHYYVSLEVLVDTPDRETSLVQSKWHYVNGSTIVGTSEENAMELMHDFYFDAERHLKRLIPTWFAANHPKLSKAATQ